MENTVSIKDRCKSLREAFPDAGYKKLSRITGVAYGTFRYHTNTAYQENQHSRLRAKAAKHKFILIQFLGGQCMKCGYRESDALDFHHRNKSQKTTAVSNLLDGKFENALEEAKKCDLLCANCHREQHADNSN